MDGDDEHIPVQSPPQPPAKEAETQAILATVDAHDVAQMTLQIEGYWLENDEEDGEESDSPDDDPTDHRANDSEYSDDETDSSPSSDDDAKSAVASKPDTWICDQFREYCERARKKTSHLANRRWLQCG